MCDPIKANYIVENSRLFIEVNSVVEMARNEGDIENFITQLEFQTNQLQNALNGIPTIARVRLNENPLD